MKYWCYLNFLGDYYNSEETSMIDHLAESLMAEKEILIEGPSFKWKIMEQMLICLFTLYRSCIHNFKDIIFY